MTSRENVLEWALVLGAVERFGEQGHDPTTDEVAGELKFKGNVYEQRRRVYTWLSRLVKDQLIARVPRQYENAMRWQLTPVGKDTCDRLRDVFAVLDSRTDNRESRTTT